MQTNDFKINYGTQRTTGSRTTIVSAAVIAIGLLIPVVFKTFFEINDWPAVEDRRPLKDKPPTDQKSCAVFLADCQSLTLDDFSSKDLTLRTISQFNNLQLGPRIQSMVQMDYFKFVKLNLHRGCSLWPEVFKCVLK